MSRNGKIRIAIWGLGSHARRNLLPAIDRSQRVDLVALCTRDEGTLGEVAELTGATPYRDVDLLLSAPDVDAVYIAAPTGVHARFAMAVLEAGKHVWCEKPMTGSYEDTLEILHAAERAGLVALESDMFLHHPQFEELHRLVRSEEVGRPISVTARFGFPHLPATDFRYSKDLGGGALLDAGFYPVAAAVGLIGSGLRLVGATMTSDDSRDVDTGGTALVASGDQVALLDWGFGRSYRNEIEVWCEGGTINVERAFSKPANLDTSIVVMPQSGDIRTIDVSSADQFARMFDTFAATTLDIESFDATNTLERARLLGEIRRVNSRGSR
ncbi:MAG: Gfo/Idh/MocA family oxidoreductase [Actinomycetia bacterium]|nr:Gfo/Idh/MocA family oxidoreductase [Actinomycetes bacterium]